MRKFMLFSGIFIALLTLKNYAQEGFYLGYEGGFSWNHFVYVNDLGYHANHFDYSPVSGGHLGRKYKNFTLETGLHWFSMGSPSFWFNYDSGEVNEYDYEGSHGPVLESWVIPLCLGYDFLHQNHQLFIKPEIGVFFLLVKDYRDHPDALGSWGQQVYKFDEPGSGYPSETEYSSGTSYVSDQFNMGFQTSLSGGYRFRYKLEIYLRLSVYSSINIIYYETYTHHMDTGDVTATHSYNGNSLSYQLGLRYYLGKSTQAKYWKRK